MIRHCVVFKLKADCPEASRDDLLRRLRDLPASYPQMMNFELGRNVSDRDDRYDYAMVIAFADREGMATYLSSERHEELVREHFKPLIEQRAIVSIEIDG